MKLLDRKTRKVIRKGMGNIKKHGPEIAAGLAGSLASTLATLASTNAPGTKAKKSNLAQLSKTVTGLLTGEDGKKSRRRESSGGKASRKTGKRGNKTGRQGEHPEPAV